MLSDLNNRGIQDILIASVDGLKGFPEANKAIFRKTEVSTIHCASNQKFRTICCFLKSKKVYERSQTYLSSYF